jgi:hypothetical protein
MRFRSLARTGKPANIVTTAIARELSGFVWAIARQVAVTTDSSHKTNDRSQRRRQRTTQHWDFAEIETSLLGHASRQRTGEGPAIAVLPVGRCRRRGRHVLRGRRYYDSRPRERFC